MLKVILEGNIGGSSVIGVATNDEYAEEIIIQRFQKMAEDGHILIAAWGEVPYEKTTTVKLFCIHYVDPDLEDPLNNYDSQSTETDTIWGIYTVQEDVLLDPLDQETFDYLEMLEGFPFFDGNKIEIIAEFEPEPGAA